MRIVPLNLNLFTFTWILLSSSAVAQKIAIIGGGISGSFTTKYLVDYDTTCQIDTITVFEPMPVRGPVKATTANDLDSTDWQGSRVTNIRLEDGTNVELGASIAYKRFYQVLEMLKGDPTLERGEPFTTGTDEMDKDRRTGMGIYAGGGQWHLLTSSSRMPKFLKKLQLLYRYNFDLLRVTKICNQAMKSFDRLPALLSSDHPDTFFDSPDDVWQSIGLLKAVHSSFDQFLDVIGLQEALPWWRKLLPFQGSLRAELLTAVNLVNYNQDNSQVNAIVGLGSFAAGSSHLFSITGGNYQIIQSALKQATDQRKENCANRELIRQVDTRVTTVVGGLDGLSLYDGSDLLGTFDIVVLAAPLQHSRIDFLVQSHLDDAVLQPMPLAGLVNAHDSHTDEGHDVLPKALPESARRPYTQVVTSVISNATLAADYFSLDASVLPRSILTNAQGKSQLHNITAITQITSEARTGVYKLFSDNRLDDAILTQLFGPHYMTEYVKVWGGPHGGATPDYQGEGAATNFLLYDGAVGFEGQTKSGALYYPSAMEQSSLASMEISAVGARAVAKLIARRLGLIQSREEEVHDEL